MAVLALWIVEVLGLNCVTVAGFVARRDPLHTIERAGTRVMMMMALETLTLVDVGVLLDSFKSTQSFNSHATMLAFGSMTFKTLKSVFREFDLGIA